ncbi:MAG: anaerobic ribonucleoside-triphosphate reductase activating protein [Candidatus Aenigmarchaeota archaeon]|nr:anaerobic ribonucleoside-triphosphate reductase activating protein [Candidatus Aenigmarchaeota archaeon]
MLIGGLQKTSLIDYPGKVSCIVWTIGCNFRCPWCYNKSLVLGTAKPIDEKEIFDFLEKRKSLLDGVVITGGEPTIQKDLISFIKRIREMGYLVKIDTNGSNPEVIKKLVDEKLVDYIAMDVKASLERYQEVTNSNIDINKISQSISIIMSSGIDYEFRTTVVPGLVSKDDVVGIAKLIKGARHYYLQRYFKAETLDDAYSNLAPPKRKELQEMCDAAKPYVECELRGL